VNSQLKLIDGISLNHEAEASVDVTVTASDSGNLFTSETFTITVTNIGVFDEEESDADTIAFLSALTLSLTLTSNNSSFVNELVIFEVEDADGTVLDAQGNPLTPGSEAFDQADYLQGILDSGTAKILLSNLNSTDELPSVLPDAFSRNGLTSTVDFEAGTRIAFFLVVNGTIDDLDSNQVFFSTLNGVLIENLTAGEFTLSFGDDQTGEFDDLVFTAQANELDNSVVVTPEDLTLLSQTLEIVVDGNTNFVEAFDFSNFDQNGDGVADNTGVTYDVGISIYREAAFDNLIGFFAVNPVDGSIGSTLLSAGNTYKQAALDNLLFSTRGTQNNAVTTFTIPDVVAGSVILPLLISNSATASADLSNVYLPFVSLNSDGADHIRSLGNGLYGLEDLPGGGDQDFDDIIIQVNVVNLAA